MQAVAVLLDPAVADILAVVSALPEAAADVRSVTFGRAEVIFKQGAPLSGLYLPVSGSVSLEVVVRSEARDVAMVAPGEFFGEAGMYGVQPADTRAVALADSDVLWLGPDTVRALFEASPRLARDTGRPSTSGAGQCSRRVGR